MYAAELVQTILFSQMAFREFAAGFGSFEALDEVGNLWFATPILSSTGMSSWSLFFISSQANQWHFRFKYFMHIKSEY